MQDRTAPSPRCISGTAEIEQKETPAVAERVGSFHAGRGDVLRRSLPSHNPAGESPLVQISNRSSENSVQPVIKFSGPNKRRPSVCDRGRQERATPSARRGQPMCLVWPHSVTHYPFERSHEKRVEVGADYVKLIAKGKRPQETALYPLESKHSTRTPGPPGTSRFSSRCRTPLASTHGLFPLRCLRSPSNGALGAA
jgi:hypothetical protein